jgi:hypothetical protein
MPHSRKKTAHPHHIPAPGLALLALELRAPWEFGAVLPAWPVLQRAPLGDGHTVIVFPGLTAGDATTIPLRRYLDSRNYDTQGWGQGLNLGPRDGVLEAAKRQLREAAQASGGKVSLVGWSLGGVYARELANQCLAHLPVRQRPRCRARDRTLQPARGASGAHHQHLFAHRWRGGLARQHPGPGAAQPAHREHRSRCQPLRNRTEP